jgi:hypothetical protein
MEPVQLLENVQTAAQYLLNAREYRMVTRLEWHTLASAVVEACQDEDSRMRYLRISTSCGEMDGEGGTP